MVEAARVPAAHTDGEYIVTLSGEIDMVNADEVKALGLAAVNRPGISVVAFDAAEVTFLDSSGIGALLDVRNAGEAAGVYVRISAASPQVARVIILCGLADSFRLD